MKTFLCKSDLKLKSGEIVKQGDPVELKEVLNERLTVLFVPSLNRSIKISVKAFAILVLGKKYPSINTLTKWDENGYCMTPMGEKVEPDGTDSYGIPCWNKIMGII